VYQIWIERRYSQKYLFLDTTPGTAGSMSAEALWPNEHGALPDAPGTLALDADLHVQHAARHGMGEEYGTTTGLHPRAFDNPAAWKRTPIIWIADDVHGIGRAETARLNGMRVEASNDHATMDDNGKVEITRGPPDEVRLSDSFSFPVADLLP
jgi:calcium permeable stress-gated cation channel